MPLKQTSKSSGPIVGTSNYTILAVGLELKLPHLVSNCKSWKDIISSSGIGTNCDAKVKRGHSQSEGFLSLEVITHALLIVFTFTPNHKPLNYRCPFKTRNLLNYIRSLFLLEHLKLSGMWLGVAPRTDIRTGIRVWKRLDSMFKMWQLF